MIHEFTILLGKSGLFFSFINLCVIAYLIIKGRPMHMTFRYILESVCKYILPMGIALLCWVAYLDNNPEVYFAWDYPAWIGGVCASITAMGLVFPLILKSPKHKDMFWQYTFYLVCISFVTVALNTYEMVTFMDVAKVLR